MYLDLVSEPSAKHGYIFVVECLYLRRYARHVNEFLKHDGRTPAFYVYFVIGSDFDQLHNIHTLHVCKKRWRSRYSIDLCA